MAAKALILSSIRMPVGPRGGVPAKGPVPEMGAVRVRRQPGLTKAELEELKEAWFEYEMTAGDWSKSR